MARPPSHFGYNDFTRKLLIFWQEPFGTRKFSDSVFVKERPSPPRQVAARGGAQCVAALSSRCHKSAQRAVRDGDDYANERWHHQELKSEHLRNENFIDLWHSKGAKYDLLRDHSNIT